MQIFTKYAAPEADPGTWFTYAPGVRFCLRRIPAWKVREIVKAHTDKVRDKSGKVTGEKRDDEAIGLAIHSLAIKDSEGMAVGIGDDATAEEMGKLLGMTLAKGDAPALDGKWSGDVAWAILRDFADLAVWVGEKHKLLSVQAVEDEEGKDKA